MQRPLVVGDIEVHWLNGGEFELDGGTMFGAVPKVLWQKRFPADAENYLAMRNAALLVKSGRELLLVDTGLGDKLSAKQKAIFRVTHDWALPADLERLGLSVHDITGVILTHCDFDHAGGVTSAAGRGPRLTFPRARHYVQRTEWQDVLAPNRRAAHSYWPENFAGLEASGLLELVDGTVDIAPGVRLELSGGHTRGHQVVRLASRGEIAYHLGDVLPTHVHFNPLWLTAYDNFPLDVVARKEEYEKRLLAENAWCLFYHDPFMLACRFDGKGGMVERWPC